MIDYSRIAPSDTFIGRYLSYMQTQETATAYDFWCSLWCLSCAVGRNSFVDRPRIPVYLNLFCVLVGESGIPRKTTSVHIATGMVRRVLGSGNEIGLMDAKVTPEKLDATLHDRTMEYGSAQLCIAIPELAVFLGTERYVSHMPILLTDLYDCPSRRDGGGTIQRGGIVQRDVWVSFLSASTPIWLLKSVNPNVIEGGFTSRCYFIIANEPKRRIPWPEERDTTLLTDMHDDLAMIHAEAKVRGSIGLTSQARTLFDEWYEQRDYSIDPFKQSFEAREDTHVLRIAALLCINDGQWCIDDYHVRRAIGLIHYVKDKSGDIFESAEARSKFAAGLDLVRSQLMTAGMDPVLRSKLYMKCRNVLNGGEFQILIDVLHEMGAIQKYHIPNEAGRGKLRDYIRGTELLLSRGLGEAVLEKFR